MIHLAWLDQTFCGTYDIFIVKICTLHALQKTTDTYGMTFLENVSFQTKRSRTVSVLSCRQWRIMLGSLIIRFCSISLPEMLHTPCRKKIVPQTKSEALYYVYLVCIFDSVYTTSIIWHLTQQFQLRENPISHNFRLFSENGAPISCTKRGATCFQ